MIMRLPLSVKKIRDFVSNSLPFKWDESKQTDQTPDNNGHLSQKNKGINYKINEKELGNPSSSFMHPVSEGLNSLNSFISYPVSRPGWPAPPSEEVFYGLPGDFVRTIEPHSEADPVAILGQFLCGFGNIIGRMPYFPVEADKHYTNFFVTVVGQSAKARKGVSWGYVKRTLKQIDPEWHEESGLSSGEGMIWAVRDTIPADLGVIDKRFLVIESELASTLKVMGREGNNLSPLIRQAWDTGDLGSLSKNSPAKATGAHISIVGHITKDELRRYLTLTESGNGFANRFLWICAKRSKELPRGGNLDSDAMSPLIERIREAVDFSQTVGEMTRDEEAWTLWDEVYSDLSKDKPGLFGAVTSRAEAQVTRLSCLYSLLDESAVVRKEHLSAALALWKYAEDSARFIFGDSMGDPVADQILEALRRHPEGMSRTDLSNLFGRNKNSDQIGRALDVLYQNGLATYKHVKTSGRDTEIWFALYGIETTK